MFILPNLEEPKRDLAGSIDCAVKEGHRLEKMAYRGRLIVTNEV